MKKLLVCGICLSVLAIGLASPLPLRAATISSADIFAADGSSGQNITTGNGIKTDHIQNAAITGAKIASGTISSGKIGDGQVFNVDLHSDAVTTDKIQDGTVGNLDLASGAVTDDKITGPISASKISFAGLNADTVDNMHASAFATATHTHAQEDVTGLADSLNGKSDVTHNHDDIYIKKYGKVAIVAQSGGDFVDPVSAMSNSALWCGTASASNPCLLKLMPGAYDLGSNSLNTKDFIDIEGSGENTTVITSSSQYGTVAGQSWLNSEIRFLTLINTNTPTNGGPGIGISQPPPKLTNVTVVIPGGGSGIGYGISNQYTANFVSVMTNVTVNVTGASGRSAFGIANFYGATMIMNNVTITVSSPGSAGWDVNGIANADASITMNNVSVTVSGSATKSIAFGNTMGSSAVITNSAFAASGTVTNEGVGNRASSLVLNDVIATAKNGSSNYGMWIQDGDVQIDRSTFEGSGYSIAGQSGYSDTLRIGSSKLVGPFSPVDTTTCVGSYDGSYAPLNATCQ
jgi:hypothetical protein